MKSDANGDIKYLKELRDKVGHQLLIVPAVAA
jgi:hypothetical protein